MVFYIPTKKDVERLKVGRIAFNCFGDLKEVTRVFAAGTDINGRVYVCYYTEFGDRAQISNSMKEGELMRFPYLSQRYTSAELDAIEQDMRQKGWDICEYDDGYKF